MNITILNSKWNKLSEVKEIKGYKALRLSSECIPDLFVGINKEGNRCLILYLPDMVNIDFNGSEKENLTFEFVKDKKIILIKLNDEDFFDLFNDLIISLYNKTANLKNADDYSQVLIQTFYKWVEFFDDKRDSRLSTEQIKGFFGELIVLHDLLITASSSIVNQILLSWKGPYDHRNDFELDKKNIEVKTKEVTKRDIRISSEYQLEKALGKELELIIVSIEFDNMKGQSLHELLVEIRKIIRKKSGDLSILLKALSQKGLTFDNTKLYNNVRLERVKLAVYSCDSEKFPKLIKSQLSEHIGNVKYNIVISGLKKFIKYEGQFYDGN